MLQPIAPGSQVPLPAEMISGGAIGSGVAGLAPLSGFSGSLGQKVHLCLRQAILTLVFRPGEILRKPDICARLGVSRSPVADAVARLAAEGLVEVQPQSGTFVSRVSMAEIREGAFLREAIEVAAAERVAQGLTGEQASLLRANLDAQAACVARSDIPGFYRADAALHGLILSFTGFRRVARVADTAWLSVNRARQLMLPVPGRMAAAFGEHRSIVAALERRDPEGARLALQHHLRQLVILLEPLETEHPEFFTAR